MILFYVLINEHTVLLVNFTVHCHMDDRVVYRKGIFIYYILYIARLVKYLQCGIQVFKIFQNVLVPV
jgi:hypothetical protein